MANAVMASHKPIRIYMDGRFSTIDVTSVHDFCFCKLFRMVSVLNGTYQYRVCRLPECFYWQTSPVLYLLQSQAPAGLPLDVPPHLGMGRSRGGGGPPVQWYVPMVILNSLYMQTTSLYCRRFGLRTFFSTNLNTRLGLKRPQYNDVVCN